MGLLDRNATRGTGCLSEPTRENRLGCGFDTSEDAFSTAFSRSLAASGDNLKRRTCCRRSLLCGVIRQRFLLEVQGGPARRSLRLTIQCKIDTAISKANSIDTAAINNASSTVFWVSSDLALRRRYEAIFWDGGGVTQASGYMFSIMSESDPSGISKMESFPWLTCHSMVLRLPRDFRVSRYRCNV